MEKEGRVRSSGATGDLAMSVLAMSVLAMSVLAAAGFLFHPDS